jgi:membrane protease YdiL (CAAX protease family)
MAARNLVRRYPVTFFVGLTYFLSWVAWAPIVGGSDLPTELFIIIGGFGPLVAAGTLTWILGDSVREWAMQVLRWRVPLRYWIVAFFLPALSVIGVSSLHILVLGGEFDPEPVSTLLLYPVVFLQVFFIGGGNEELGWRGFALPRLQEQFSAFVASLIIGVVWFAWHLPLFFVSGSSQAGDPLAYYAISVIALSFVFTWVYNQTEGSVLVTMALHASVNSGGLLYLAGGGAALQTNLGNGLVAGGFLVLGVLVVLVYGPERLADADIPTGPAGRETVGR